MAEKPHVDDDFPPDHDNEEVLNYVAAHYVPSLSLNLRQAVEAMRVEVGTRFLVQRRVAMLPPPLVLCQVADHIYKDALYKHTQSAYLRMHFLFFLVAYADEDVYVYTFVLKRLEELELKTDQDLLLQFSLYRKRRETAQKLDKFSADGGAQGQGDIRVDFEEIKKMSSTAFHQHSLASEAMSNVYTAIADDSKNSVLEELVLSLQVAEQKAEKAYQYVLLRATDTGMLEELLNHYAKFLLHIKRDEALGAEVIQRKNALSMPNLNRDKQNEGKSSTSLADFVRAHYREHSSQASSESGRMVYQLRGATVMLVVACLGLVATFFLVYGPVPDLLVTMNEAGFRRSYVEVSRRHLRDMHVTACAADEVGFNASRAQLQAAAKSLWRLHVDLLSSLQTAFPDQVEFYKTPNANVNMRFARPHKSVGTRLSTVLPYRNIAVSGTDCILMYVTSIHEASYTPMSEFASFKKLDPYSFPQLFFGLENAALAGRCADQSSAIYQDEIALADRITCVVFIVLTVIIVAVELFTVSILFWLTASTQVSHLRNAIGSLKNEEDMPKNYVRDWIAAKLSDAQSSDAGSGSGSEVSSDGSHSESDSTSESDSSSESESGSDGSGSAAHQTRAKNRRSREAKEAKKAKDEAKKNAKDEAKKERGGRRVALSTSAVQDANQANQDAVAKNRNGVTSLVLVESASAVEKMGRRYIGLSILMTLFVGTIVSLLSIYVVSLTAQSDAAAIEVNNAGRRMWLAEAITSNARELVWSTDPTASLQGGWLTPVNSTEAIRCWLRRSVHALLSVHYSLVYGFAIGWLEMPQVHPWQQGPLGSYGPPPDDRCSPFTWDHGKFVKTTALSGSLMRDPRQDGLLFDSDCFAHLDEQVNMASAAFPRLARVMEMFVDCGYKSCSTCTKRFDAGDRIVSRGLHRLVNFMTENAIALADTPTDMLTSSNPYYKTLVAYDAEDWDLALTKSLVLYLEEIHDKARNVTRIFIVLLVVYGFAILIQYLVFKSQLCTLVENSGGVAGVVHRLFRDANSWKQTGRIPLAGDRERKDDSEGSITSSESEDLDSSSTSSGSASSDGSTSDSDTSSASSSASSAAGARASWPPLAAAPQRDVKTASPRVLQDGLVSAMRQPGFKKKSAGMRFSDEAEVIGVQQTESDWESHSDDH